MPKSSEENGAQIDLLFDRSDGAVNICEIKYCSKPYEIDKQYASNLAKKCRVYEKITKDQRQIFLSIITSNRLKKNIYSEELIASEVKLEDFFKEL